MKAHTALAMDTPSSTVIYGRRPSITGQSGSTISSGSRRLSHNGDTGIGGAVGSTNPGFDVSAELARMRAGEMP